MTYRLKDRTLEEKLVSIFPEFVDRFDLAAKTCREVKAPAVTLYRALNHSGIRFQIWATWDVIEDTNRFKSFDWNWWPDVEPPRNMMMRVSVYDKGHILLHACKAYWDGVRWMTWNGYELNDGVMIRFRPWED